MEMCFTFLNGSRTTIFLESMRFCMIVEKKIQVQASASWQQRAQPESTASLNHTCSSPRELRQDSLDLVLRGRTVCSPACHRTHMPRQESKTTGFWQMAAELDCPAPDCGPSCVVQTCLQPNRLQIQVHSCRRVTGKTIFLYSHLASEGGHGLFPSVWQSPKHFPSRGKNLRLGY